MLKKPRGRPDGVSVVGQLSVWDKVSHRRLEESVWSEVRADPRLVFAAAAGQALPRLLWTLAKLCPKES